MDDNKKANERSSQKDLNRQNIDISDYMLPEHLLNSIRNIFIILNQNREIVYANQALLNVIDSDRVDKIIGFRPGEALKCIYSCEDSEGCGESEFCEKCGANLAIRGALSGKDEFRECSLLRDNNGNLEALDLNIWANPFEYKGEKFVTFIISDISNEKRRRTLERIFFHDILNVAGGIKSFTEYLREIETGPIRDKLGLIHEYAEQLVNEIQSQRELLAAENNELEIEPIEIESPEFLEFVAGLYREQVFALSKTILLSPDSESVKFRCDKTILGRVLGNMVKNALEATDRGGAVTLGCVRQDDKVSFYVHNNTYMPHEVQIQVFKRSFSTKGADRGLGTYSLKLLTERYLRGKVFFNSTKEEGTTFYVEVPSIPESNMPEIEKSE